MREIVGVILRQGRTGFRWSYMPADLAPPSAVRYYFCTRRDDGTSEVLHELLRCQVRERAERTEDPGLVVLDAQSLHAAAGVPAATTGRDAVKEVPGRKRGPAVDVLGLVMVMVMVASVHDNTTGADVPDGACTVRKALVGQGSRRPLSGTALPGRRGGHRRARPRPEGFRSAADPSAGGAGQRESWRCTADWSARTNTAPPTRSPGCTGS